MHFTIEKEVRWESAHILLGLEDGHPCGRMHGHSYRALITLSGGLLDETGFLLDFGLIKREVMTRFDHRLLNEQMRTNPTAENIAVEIMGMINEVIFRMEAENAVKVERVRVWETETCWAEVRP